MHFPKIPHAELLRRRNAYAYPAFALEGNAESLTPVDFKSSFELDTHINCLLTSLDNSRKVVGYLAVIYWGHVSGLDGRHRRERACGRVALAYHGRDRTRDRMRGVRDLTESVVAATIAKAAQTIESDEYGKALQLLLELPQLQIAFASKVCAFLNPDKCGVIDSVIVESHPLLGFQVRDGFVTNTATNRRLYGEYCSLLQAAACDLNGDPNYRHWTDRDGTQRSWRAVDVERALYG